MSILQEILKWSTKELPLWQQDAVARLYSQGQLNAQDIDDIYALLTDAHGLPDPLGRIPNPLSSSELSAPHNTETKVQLIGLKDLKHVNALANNHRLPIHPTGLTIIYGANGSGKSGYSRVFKKACRARDQRENIHPNVNLEMAVKKPPEAVFEILVDGDPQSINWKLGEESSDHLSTIAIFDSHCARAYVDNQGDFAYVPYGLDIIEGLVALCKKLNSMLSDEKSKTLPNVASYSYLIDTTTTVGKVMGSLSAETKSEYISQLAKLSQEELSRFEILKTALAETDPKQKGQALRNHALRFSNLSSKILQVKAQINDDVVLEFKKLVEKYHTDKLAAEVAGKQFRETPGLLNGTGGALWKSMFEAAKDFVKESHTKKVFPHLGPESLCPLCQKVLEGEGESKIISFEEFYQQAAEKAFEASKVATRSAYKKLQDTSLNIGLDEALMQDIQLYAPHLIDELKVLQNALETTHSSILEASANASWDHIPKVTETQSEALNALNAKLIEEAVIVEATMNEQLKASLIKEKAELDARLKLADAKEVVLSAIKNFIVCKKLTEAERATATISLSKKSTELSRTMATSEVAEALNAEFRHLNVHELKVVMKAESPGGKMRFKLVLETTHNTAAKDILSEGEQRAIAIASFLAEVKLNNGPGAIIFDDPVSSLDHARRVQVAKRLCIEGRNRQVIILTHDIHFLLLLQNAASREQVENLTLSLRRTREGYGVHSERLPFDALKTTSRISQLRDIQQQADVAHKVGDEDLLSRIMADAYSKLRMTWERAIEEVLLNGVVTRFGLGIATQKIREVSVENTDYQAIDKAMDICSKYVAHDAAAETQIT